MPGAMNEHDTALLIRARELDPQALVQIFDAYFERLYRYAYHYVGNPDTAQDIASESFRRLLESLRDHRAPQCSLATWLYRVTYHLAMDSFRRAPPGGAVPLDSDLDEPAETNTEQEAEQRITEQRIRDALLELTPDQQSVVVLKFMEGYSNTEIGSLLNKPEGAVKALQHRALAALRRLLRPTDRNQKWDRRHETQSLNW